MRRTLCVTILFLLAPSSVAAQSIPRGTEDEIRNVARRYFDARVANDTAVARALLAEKYTGINSNGVMGDRASALRLPMNVTPNGQLIVAFDHDSVEVRVYGPTAIMTGIRKPRGPTGSTGPGVRFTLLFVQHEGRWQIAASQATDRPRDATR